MERMTHDDSVFLRIEDDVHHMHLGSVAVFDGPAPAYDELRSTVSALLPLAPRYRQRVRFVPFDIQRPVWVEDSHFNLDYHVRHTALPAPGSEDQLRNLVGRVMSQRLDRRKPLWELWVIEGLSDDRWVLLSKVHHALINAVVGSDILTLMLDRATESDRPAAPVWNPAVEPSDLALAVHATRDLVTDPVEQYRVVREAVRKVSRVRDQAAASASRLSALAPPDRGAGSLTGRLGPHRRWTDLRVSMDEVTAVSAGLGGSVNDVILASVALGLRALLLQRGETVERRSVSTFVPMSMHSGVVGGVPDNTVSSSFTDLPVGVEDAAETLRLITRQSADLEDSNEAVAGEVLTPISGFAPPLLLSLGMRAATRAAGELEGAQTITTCVPGPSHTLYLLGRPLRRAHPYAPLRGNMRLTVAAFSYAGGLHFGITGDYDTTADLDVLAEGIVDGLTRLREAAGAALEASSSPAVS